MPSDPRAQQALDALAELIEAFRSTLASTSEQIRLLIDTRVDRNGATVEVARAGLGDFAAGRIDPERMAKLLSQVEPPPLEHGDVVERALGVCDELMARRENLFRVDVREGQDLHSAVHDALADIGRAFGVSRIVELVARGQYSADAHDSLLVGHPFERWSRAERRVELALVVCVAGRDLRVGSLVDVFDHSMKIVLVVRGDAPPAPLVRLITPNVLVVQTVDALEVDFIARHDGPGVLGLMTGNVAQFRHDPAGGPTLADRMVITHLPDSRPAQLGVSSAFQQEQDLAQLEALGFSSAAATVRDAPDATSPAQPRSAEAEGEAPAGATEVVEPEAAAPALDAAGKLSAWLLEQADLQELPPT